MGYVMQFNDNQVAYLRDHGITPEQINQMWWNFLGTLGKTGTLTDRFANTDNSELVPPPSPEGDSDA